MSRQKLSPRTIRNKLKTSISLQVNSEIERINSTFKMWPPVDPEYILWSNIGYSNDSRRMRKAFSLLVATLIIGFSVYLVFYIKSLKLEINQQSQAIECDSSITKESAYLDVQQDPAKQRGLMPCFCYNLLTSNYKAFLDLSFSEFDSPNYCN